LAGLFSQLARLHGMDGKIWERHANPWSGWSRVPILPLGAWAIWARDDLGQWLWAILAALAAWAWLNPRIFPPPRSTSGWMSRAVLGERVWLNRREVPVPLHYVRAVPVILAFAAAGLPLLAWGLWRESGWTVVFGLFLALMAKFWFLDRMVWLYDDMAARHPIYREWLRP
jgi:hypothetical protein